jgi:hypothetical protein
VTAQDIRVGRWDLHATAGDTPSLVTTWADETGDPYTLTGKTVTMWIGGTITDPTDLTDATEISATIATNTATFTPTIPTTAGTTPLRVTIDGTLRALGSLTVSTVGAGSPDLDVTVNVAPISFDVTLTAPSGVLFAQHDNNVTYPRPDTVGPVLWVGP